MADRSYRNSNLAQETAELLIKSYVLQDEIEDIKSLNDKKSIDKASKAYDSIEKVYIREFPNIEQEKAISAARNHLDPLFIQDIIENYGDEPIIYQPDWAEVNEKFCSICEKFGIDNSYADRMTEFFRLHGQNIDGWKTHARRAHQIKIKRITGSNYWASLLSDYFVQGVELHDRNLWDKATQVIAFHYQQLFQITDLYAKREGS